jgi:protein ImuB
MRLLYLLWPHLPLRLARARLEAGGAISGSWPTGPIVLGGQPWTDGIVLDADPLARALGVRRGIPLGSAHRQAPEAVFLDPTPDEDRAAVEAACERLAGFSPGIAGTSDVADPAFGRLIVHADGLVRLWGAEERLVARINEALAPVLPGSPRAGIAGTGFAAGVAAAYAEPGGPPTLVPPGDDERFLAPYPARLLTKDPDIRARLSRFGLRTIGAVAELPRSALVARFGDEGARLHARARGEETERFRPRKTPERMTLGLPLDPPAEGLDALRFVLRRLSATLADQLAARGQAAGMARLAVTHDLAFARRGTPQMLRFEQRFPEPTADAEAIERLLYARLEGSPPPAAVSRLELELGLVEAARGQQLPLFTPQAARGARLEWQLARLAIAFGADRVRRVEVGDTDAPLAEARWTWQPIAGAEVTGAADAARAGGGRTDTEQRGGARAGGERGAGDRGGGQPAPATVAAGYGAGALGRSAGRELGSRGSSGAAR